MHEIPLTELPSGLREGDVLRRTGDGYALDQEEKERRKRHNQALFNRLMARCRAVEEETPPQDEETPPE